ncbi:recombinase family protein [Streptomyces albidoflavus]|nr:recombinase family protein [Streptomyces albidoflavus]
MPARSAAVVTRAAGDVIPGAPARERADGRGLRRRAHHRLGGRLGGLRGHRSDARPNLGPWLRDERVPYDGLVAAAVDRLGRNVVVCLNTGYKMRDEKKMLVTYGHEGAWDLDDSADENRFTMEAWGAQMELRAIQRRNRDATVRTRAAGRPRGPHRPVPSQAAPRGRLAARHPRPLRPLLRTFLGLDRRRQRPARP